MFIHIGNNNVIHSGEIISIVDHSVVTSSSIMVEMIRVSKQQNKVIEPKSVAKSVVITKDLIYFSSLSVHTLKKRSSITSMINKLELINLQE